MIDFIEIDVDNVEKSRYKEFVVDSIDEKDIKESEKLDKEFKETVEKMVGKKQKLNKMLYYLTMIFAFVTLIFGLLMFQKADPETNYFPWGFLAAMIVSALVDIGLGIGQSYVKKDIKKTMQCEEIQKFGVKNMELENRLLEKLGVPEDRNKIDIFARNVRVKNGELLNALRVSYNNYNLYAYQKDGCIYFCDTYELIKLDLKEVQSVKLIKDKITFTSWTKKESPREEKYKPYNVKVTASGFYSVNCFFDINIKHKGSDYVLRLPGYEVDFVKANFDYQEGRDDVIPQSEETKKETKQESEPKEIQNQEEEKHEDQ